jgi:hypothetical protein
VTEAEFYVAVAAEVDEGQLVADIAYAGEEVASVRNVGGTWMVTLYVPVGADRADVPLDARGGASGRP